MITQQQNYQGRKCQSSNVRWDGYHKAESKLYHCIDCNFYGVIHPKVKYTGEKKEQIIKTYQKRASMRGIQRIYGTAPATLSKWIKKSSNTDNWLFVTPTTKWLTWTLGEFKLLKAKLDVEVYNLGNTQYKTVFSQAVAATYGDISGLYALGRTYEIRYTVEY